MLLKVRKSHNSILSVSLEDLPCWCFLVTIFFVKGFDLAISSGISLILLGIFFIFSLPKILSEKYTLTSMLLYCFIIFIGVVNYIFGNSETFLFFGLALIVSRGFNPKKVLKLGFYILSISLLLMVIFSTLGLIENQQFVIFREGEGFVQRNAFGYSHPNAFHLSFFICSTLYLILYYRKSNIFIIVFFIILVFLVYYFTKSRTGLLLSLLSFILYYLFYRFDYLKTLFLKFSPLLISICIVIPFALGVAYGHLSVANRLDSILSGRIYYISYLLNNFQIPVFGNSIYNNYVFFDSGVVSLLYESGLLAFIIFMFLLFSTMKYLRRKKEFSLVFLLVIFAMYGITESFFQSITSNISLFLFLYVLNNKKNIIGV